MTYEFHQLIVSAHLPVAGYLLGVAASWIVNVGIDVQWFPRAVFAENEEEEFDKTAKVKLLEKRLFSTTIRCGSSLIFASVGAGVGALLIRPSLGQWIGKLSCQSKTHLFCLWWDTATIELGCIIIPNWVLYSNVLQACITKENKHNFSIFQRFCYIVSNLNEMEVISRLYSYN